MVFKVCWSRQLFPVYMYHGTNYEYGYLVWQVLAALVSKARILHESSYASARTVFQWKCFDRAPVAAAMTMKCGGSTLLVILQFGPGHKARTVDMYRTSLTITICPDNNIRENVLGE